MSLIYFHITLIAIAVLFSFGFGIWEWQQFSELKNRSDLWVSLISFLFSLIAAVYLIWFVKRKKPQMKSLL